MLHYTFPNKVVIGLKSIMPIAYFVNSVPHKKVTIVYFDHMPWKLYCCIWSFVFRWCFPRIKKLYSDSLDLTYLSSLNDVIVAYGNHDQINYIKTHFQYKNLVVITKKEAKLDSMSNLCYNYTSKVDFNIEFKDQYIPNLIYDATKKIIINKKYINDILFSISLAFKAVTIAGNNIFVKTHALNVIVQYLDILKKLDKLVNIKLQIINKKTINKLLGLNHETWLIFNALSNYVSNDIYLLANSCKNFNEFKNKITANYINYLQEFINSVDKNLIIKDKNFLINKSLIEEEAKLYYVLYFF